MDGSPGLTPPELRLGDMLVVAPERWPGKLMKALAVIAETIHPAFDRQSWIAAPGKSKESCVLASLTAQDFLREIGFDARVRSVACLMRAERAGQELHSLGVGAPPKAYGPRSPTTPGDEPGRWDGHLVVTVPSAGALIDLTLYPSIRPEWESALPGMVTLPYEERGKRRRPHLFGRPAIAGAELDGEDGYRFQMVWLDRPENKLWRRGGDAESWRRASVVIALRDKFGVWKD